MILIDLNNLTWIVQKMLVKPFFSEQIVYHGFAALFEEQIHEFNKTE